MPWLQVSAKIWLGTVVAFILGPLIQGECPRNSWPKTPHQGSKWEQFVPKQPIVPFCCHLLTKIPKDLLYGELVQGKRPTGRPQLRFKDVCKRDLKALNIDQNNWEQQPSNSQPGDRLCRKVSPTSKRRSLSSTGKREWEERLQPMQTGQRQTSSVSSATGTIIPASDWLATFNAVPE